jgi:hypothetical protein
MSWDTYIPGESPTRTLDVSKELYDAANQYRNETKCSIQFLFDSAIQELIRIWGGGTESVEPEDEQAIQQVKDIIVHNPMPGKVDRNKRRYRIGLNITSPRRYNWFINLETYSVIPSMSSAICRILSWSLKKEGFLSTDQGLHTDPSSSKNCVEPSA